MKKMEESPSHGEGSTGAEGFCSDELDCQIVSRLQEEKLPRRESAG